MSADHCPACGNAWANHPGIAAMCVRLQAAREEAETLRQALETHGRIAAQTLTAPPMFFDPAQHPPPGGKLILLTHEETCVIGKWGEGFKGWFPLPRIPADMKRGAA